MARSMWGVRRRKRPILPGFADRKRAAFFAAAVRRCAWNDYESVGVRELAGYAGVSVDTFYDRFGSQRAFWYAVATAQFQAVTRAINREFDPKTWVNSSPQTIVRRIVRHVASCVASDTIGITRMTVRLTMTAPRAAEAFEEYRSALTDRAVMLLASKLMLPDPEKAVHQAMRVVLAVATDTAWRHHGPLLKSERKSLVDELANQMCRSLGIQDTKPERPNGSSEECDTEPNTLAIFRGVLHEPGLPIYGEDLKVFEKAATSYKSKMKPSGRLTDPEDALAASLRDEQPPPRNPRRPARKPKKRFRFI